MTYPESEYPLVSIVTPHINGREYELLRCMASVIAVDWPRVQHVIVSDRTDRQEALSDEWEAMSINDDRLPTCAKGWLEDASLDPARMLTFVQINEAWRSPDAERSIASIPFYIGSLLALGEFVGFLGDDDELLPDHITMHVSTMRIEQAHFSVSPVLFRADGNDWNVIGGAFAHGSMDADGIMCHRDALAVANWSVSAEPGLEAAGDYRLVRDWLNAGLKGSLLLGPPTAIHNDGWLVGKTGRPDRPR